MSGPACWKTPSRRRRRRRPSRFKPPVRKPISARFGVIGGAQAGFNYQFNSIVLGVEGTWTDSGISGSQATSTSLAPLLGISENSTDAPLWYATATGRAGYAANDVLIYAKGGAAWMNAITPSTVVIPAGVVSSATHHQHPPRLHRWRRHRIRLYRKSVGQTRIRFPQFRHQDLRLQQPRIISRPVPVGAFPVSIKSSTYMFLFVRELPLQLGWPLRQVLSTRCGGTARAGSMPALVISVPSS